MTSTTKTARDVRQAFLDYFKKNGHEVVASSALVPANDPTLMFANAGMVQFKDVFTGKEKRSYTRATSSQKCMRISGKHNDLENVGRTARHHTFFEMLGNFSFGDYFKEAAIHYAWELVTKGYGVPTDRLVVTYFRGEAGVPEDTEAKNLWKKISGLPDDRILGMGMADNFWSMGDTGPCGPCSEIHFFQGVIGSAGQGAKTLKNAVDPRTFGEEPRADGTGWMEIWNLVFMQFERFADASLKPLPAQSVDTGMGLERITSIVQGVTSNYDTDLLRALVDRASRISKKKYAGTMSDDDVSMRVIADHARATAFLIAEGIFPDRAGREYVLRRVMRRAIRHGHRLGIDRPFLHEVAGTVVDTMGDDYPELRRARATISNVAEQEEVRFRQTIDRGLKILDEELAKPDVSAKKELPGNTAFTLYDTYGFPLDLTEVICEERGYRVDLAGYDKAMEGARARSEGSKVGDAAVGAAYRQVVEILGAPTRFVGYEREQGKGIVRALLRGVGGGELVDELRVGDEGEVFVEETPFYAEAGGQVGDRGTLRSSSDALFRVDTVHKPHGVYAHHGTVTRGSLKVGDVVELEVDHDARSATRRNHSATHLLHFALRHVLGEHVQQKGSLVGPDRLRFDYSHGKALSAAEIAQIEDVVNEMVLANAEVQTKVLPIDEARKTGAMAIFEEKYGDVVRVLTMDAGRYKSVELCGGTHAGRTGDVGLFRVASDKAIAAGVRRLEATTGFNTLKEVRGEHESLASIERALNADAQTALSKVEKLLADQRALEKKVADLEKKIALGGDGGPKSADVKKFGWGEAVFRRADVPRNALREEADRLRDRHKDAVVLVASGTAGELVLAVSSSLPQFDANALFGSLKSELGVRGGGRRDLAQGGGLTDPDRAKTVFFGLKEFGG